MNWCGRALFESPIDYALCMSDEEFRKEAIKHHVRLDEGWLPVGANACTHTLTDQQGNTEVVIVCIEKKTGWKVEQVHSLLVHEAVHVWQAIRKVVGEGRPSIELEAYAIERISENLFNSYRKQTGRK